MHSAFSRLVFPISMFTPFLYIYERAMGSLEKWHLKITIIIIIIINTSVLQVGFELSNWML